MEQTDEISGENVHMTAYLTCENPAYPDITINTLVHRIGRSLDNHTVLSDPNISRLHCIIQFKQKKWWIIDKSQTGVFVNQVKQNETTLNENDTITFGPVSQNLTYKFTSRNDIDAERTAPIRDATKRKLEQLETKCSKLQKLEDAIERDLSCAICGEIYITATVTSCQHTFCRYCIARWFRTSSQTCPECRANVHVTTRNLALDNFITNAVSALDEELMGAREREIKRREKEETERVRKKKRAIAQEREVRRRRRLVVSARRRRAV